MTNPTTSSTTKSNPSPNMSAAVVAAVGENGSGVAGGGGGGGSRSLFRPPPLTLSLSSDYSPPSPRMYPPQYSPAALSYFGGQNAASPTSAPSSPSTPYFFPFSHPHPYASRQYLQIESYSAVLASMGAGGAVSHPPTRPTPIFSVSPSVPCSQPNAGQTHFGLFPPPPPHLHPVVPPFAPPPPKSTDLIVPLFGGGVPLGSPKRTPPISPASSSSQRSPSPSTYAELSLGSPTALSPFRLPCGKEGSLKHRILIRPSPGQGPGSDVPCSPRPLPLQVNPLPRNDEGNGSPKVGASGHVSSPKRSRSSSSSSSPKLTGQPHYPAHFRKGSIIELANGELKCVEDLRTEDFVKSAQLSADLQIDSSTVVKIEDRPRLGTVTLGFSVGIQRIQVSVEATMEHPFFVFGQGWSSCCPERTLQRYSLSCHRLQVGDVCISLTHRQRRSSPPASSLSDGASGRPVLPTVTVTPTVAASQKRKRRWSASDALTLTATVATSVEQRSNSLAEANDAAS